MHCNTSIWMRNTHGKWTRVGETPDGPVAVRASAVLGRRVYLFGGCSEVPGGVINRDGAYRYDPSTAQWQKLRPLPGAVRGLSATPIDSNRILLVGGYTASAHDAAASNPAYGFSDRVWIYNTAQDTYEAATPLPFAASGIEILLHDGAVFALGGEDRMRGRSRRSIQGKIE
jgi:N-acetylneuraminic acid mutarotase